MARPTLEQFDPSLIAWHNEFIDVFYNKIIPRSLTHGTQQIMLSGAVGSAKSLVMEHIISRYLVEVPNAHIGIGRLTMPDLKATLYTNICEHLPERILAKPPAKVSPKIELINGSELTGKSWSDYNLAKLGSYEFNAFAIEELTESDRPDAYNVILQRIRRNGDNGAIVPKFLISATNPNSPSHWAYKKLIEKAGWVDGKRAQGKDLDDNIWIFYSVTTDNPFLD